MAKRQKKPKARQQKPKKRKRTGSGAGSSSSSKGTMTGLRSMFKKTARSVAGADSTKKKPTVLGRVVDGILWLGVAGAIGYFIYNAQCIR